MVDAPSEGIDAHVSVWALELGLFDQAQSVVYYFGWGHVGFFRFWFGLIADQVGSLTPHRIED